MPRRPKPPPPILFVQSLSTGRLLLPPSVDSDLEPGVVIPRKQDVSPVHELPSGNEVLARQKNKKVAAQLDLLKAVGIVADDRPKPAPKPSLPTKPGCRTIRLGKDLVIFAPVDPIRRGR